MSSAVSTDTTDARSIFDRVPLLAAMPRCTRDELWSHARIRTGDRGDVLVLQGAPTDFVHVLLTGEATSICVTVAGRSVALARWLAPTVIDKVTMFAEAQHPASVSVDTASVWCTLPFAAVRSAIATNPAAQQHALANVTVEARSARNSFVDAAIRSSTARLARWLVISMDVGVPITLPSPQERLALQLGMTRVTMNRALHSLAARELIEIDGSTVLVLDLIHLRTVAEL